MTLAPLNVGMTTETNGVCKVDTSTVKISQVSARVKHPIKKTEWRLKEKSNHSGKFAESFGKNAVTLATNLRQTQSKLLQ